MKFRLRSRVAAGVAAAGLGLGLGLVSAVPIRNDLPLSEKGSIGTFHGLDITRDVLVKGIHSHNDYWRDVPLFSALSYGVVSVEADVWHFQGDDTLYVGHNTASLASDRTLASLYIDPLLDILAAANPKNQFTVNQTVPNGVFDTYSEQTLYLFIDVKTDGMLTWPFVEAALKPLLDKGWLTTVSGKEITTRPVTVIGTGNTPYAYLVSQKDRFYFFDGPIEALNETAYPAHVNPIASGSLQSAVGSKIGPNGLDSAQYNKIKGLVDRAHDMGIATRFWEVPWWPVVTRNALYRQIIEIGSDLLNADDLALAATFV
ncbi:hypothetical protein V1525DRAFT_399025 [Lipomyces kononenkoae]|uniref:Uncharacterized protein n=1 Tax=Lipomyces kononenkoae TaxID=34357 RepID=A0ACC3T5R8_LIPKO